MIDLRRFRLVLFTGSMVLWCSAQRLSAQHEPVPPLDPAAKKAAGQFLERLFDAALRNAERQPTDAVDAPPDQGAPLDRVDERAVVNREHRTLLLRAQRMLTDGRHAEGLRLVQHLLNADEDSLVMTEAGEWRSLHAVAEEAVLLSPPDVRARYGQLYGNAANDLLQQARSSDSLRTFAIVTRQYFATSAGEAAASEIATRMLDAGQPAEAIYWYQRLIDSGASLSRDPQWRRQANTVLERFGRSAGSNSQGASAGPKASGSNRGTTHTIVSTTPEFSEWEQPFGGPTQTGRVAASKPVLIERWTQPVTERFETAAQMARLIADLQDGGQACIPAAIPLAVDGKIVFRTLRGLSVVDAASGRLLWETPEAVSVERLLAGEPATRPAGAGESSRLRPLPPYEGNGADQHALTNLLFRDGVYGMVSSDGQRVFVLEDHATLSYRPPGYYRGQPHGDDPHGRDWESNRIAAYDLASGRRLWSLGGPEQSGPFHPVLGGTLFQGPPVVDGDELFAIGEHQGAEILYVLDRRTGRPLWTQMLSAVTAEIQYDLVRRWWPALPAVGKGIVICPTTVGWLIAVDRHERRIRWASRLTPRRQGRQIARQSEVAMTGPLNTRWSPSAPVLSGDRIIFTPSEFPDVDYHTSPEIICLDAVTGDIRWDREKESGLYLGGVVDDGVLLVGSDQLVLRSVSDGRLRWSRSFPDDSGPPSGRGVVTGADYLLPLQSGALWRVQIADGTLAERMAFGDKQPALGNLLVYRNQLVSLTAFGLTCFEDRAAVESLMAGAGRRPLAPAEQLRAAELHVIDGNESAAAELLRHLDATALDEAGEARVRSLRRQSLAAAIRKDLQSPVSKLDELESLADTQEDLLSARRLRAEHHAARGEHTAAFDVYWRLAQTPSSTLVVDGETSLRLDRWLAARLNEVWTTMNPAEQAGVDRRIDATVISVREGLPEFWNWWAQVLAFHPSGRELEQHLAEQARREGRIADAEIRWLRLLDERHPVESRIAALHKLVALLDGQDRAADAIWYMTNSLESIAVDDPRAAAELRDRGPQRQTGVDGPLPVPPFPDWSSDQFSLTRTISPGNRQTPFVTLEIVDGVPSLDGLRLLLQPGLQRLSIETGERRRVWETSLRAQPQLHYSQTANVPCIGQLLFVVHREMLHALSLPDRELLWQRPLELPAGTSGYVQAASSAAAQEMTEFSSFQARDGLTRRRADDGAPAVCRPEYVCFSGRNSITAADPLTGETLWTRSGIRPRSVVCGNRRYVFVISPRPAAPMALQAADGMPAELPELEARLAAAVDVCDEGLVTLDLETSASRRAVVGSGPVRLRLIDPATGSSAWEVSFPEDTKFARLDGSMLLALEPGGKVRQVDWTRRRDRTVAQLDPDAMTNVRSIYAAADRRQVYLSLNARPDRGYRSDVYASLPVNGRLIALDRIVGGIAWQMPIKNQYLLLEHLKHLPVLVLHARRAELAEAEIRAQKVQVELLDKWSGRPLLNEARYVSPGSVRSVEFDLAARTIDLEAYRERLRIQPAEPAEAGESAEDR
ncbi:MAG: PQQ-binding-like beta-propeller repeat protein [Planctomycetaceae bacterium]